MPGRYRRPCDAVQQQRVLAVLSGDQYWYGLGAASVRESREKSRRHSVISHLSLRVIRRFAISADTRFRICRISLSRSGQ